MDLSIVVPIYRCEDVLYELCERLEIELARIPTINSYEIILVEDGGSPRSWQIIKEVAAKRPRIRGLKLSRNFGQHNAITAGLILSTGRWVVVMDGDLQDRPEDIRHLWRAVGPDVDMVCARRPRREHAWWRRMASRFWFKMFSALSGVTLDPAVTNFRIMNRTVVDAFLSLSERNRVLGAHLQWLGFTASFVDLTHEARPRGKSSYSLRKLAKLATDVIICHSNRPLILSVLLGGGICLVTLCIMVYVLYGWSTRGVLVQGWISLMLSVWFLGGAIIANLGLLGIYLGRVYDETKRRPNFVIARTVNVNDDAAVRALEGGTNSSGGIADAYQASVRSLAHARLAGSD